MTSSLTMDARPDRTELAWVLRSGIALGLLQSALVALFGFLQPRLDGVLELVACGPILLVGLALTITLPGTWTRARTIEGIAGAAGIGFAAAIVFLIVDVAIFQPVGLYTNRWLAIGGGSNWWYHPVWWMVGTYLPLMGAWTLANQADQRGEPSPAALVVMTFLLAAILLGIAVFVGFPGARFGLGGFAIAVLPALALEVLVTGLGARRR
jgi:hypothetical protein